MQEPDFLEPDQSNLDKEWVRQPKLIWRYSMQLAEARLKVSKAKSSLEVVEAELDRAIRKTPENYGILKITEGTVERMIRLQDEYKEAVRDLYDAKHEEDVIQAMCNALEHRKRALEGLVSLHAQNYFAEPRVPKGSEEAVDTMKKRSVYNKGK